MLHADRLTPSKNYSLSQRRCLSIATYLVLQSQSIPVGVPMDTEATRLYLPPYKALPTPGTVCWPGLWPLGASKGHRWSDGGENANRNTGTWWAVTSHGLPAYVRTSKPQAVTHSISRDSHKAGNREINMAGRPWRDSCHCLSLSHTHVVLGPRLLHLFWV